LITSSRFRVIVRDSARTNDAVGALACSCARRSLLLSFAEFHIVLGSNKAIPPIDRLASRFYLNEIPADTATSVVPGVGVTSPPARTM
jgi:hypothetical protein